MLVQPKFQKQMDEVVEEWNRAEALAKTAERLRSELVMPAVAELRYAGRKIVEALATPTNAPERQVSDLVDDAIYRCQRAQQDSIDASLIFISQSLDSLKSHFDDNSARKEAAEFQQLLALVHQFNSVIADSRGDRSLRPELYRKLTAELPSLVEKFESIRLMPETWDRGKSRHVLGHVLAVLLAGLGFSFTAFLTEKGRTLHIAEIGAAIVAVGAAMLLKEISLRGVSLRFLKLARKDD